MTTYQIRNGVPALGHYGTGPTTRDYKAMQYYLFQKKMKMLRRRMV
jgi:hypothetical protein